MQSHRGSEKLEDSVDLVGCTLMAQKNDDCRRFRVVVGSETMLR